GGRLICQFLKHAHSAVAIHAMDGKKRQEVELPGIGTAGGFGGRMDDKEVFYAFTSFTEPGSIHRLRLDDGTSTLWNRPEVDFDGDVFETKQVFFKSKDGTRVPMFVTHRKG